MSTPVGVELRSATALLAERGVEDARFDAELLLADVIGVDRTRLVVERARVLDRDQQARFAELVRRRARRVPLQQLRGKQEFYSRDFVVDAHVLVPRAETETLVDVVLEVLQNREQSRLLDVGTGSGAIAVTVALELPRCRVSAVEISLRALAIARHNAQRLGASVDFRSGDLCSPFAAERFDVVVSNPPYVRSAEIERLSPEVRDHEPRVALDGGADGLDVFRRLAADAPALLADGGELIVEVGCGQSGAVGELFVRAGLEIREMRKDLMGIERVVRAGRG